jgi:uncharacterized delta-60 repeat protein
VTVALLGFPAAAAPGDLDPSFGHHGLVTTRFGNYQAHGCDVAFGPSGRIIVIGGTQNGFAIAAYRHDGSPDRTFSGDGTVWHDFTGKAYGTEGACGVAVQPDGRILVGGGATYGTPIHGVVARYLPNGTLDPSFGDRGVVHLDDVVSSILVQPDGKIVVADYVNVVRLRADGSLDSSFRNGGKATTGFDPESVALQPDGKIVVAGPEVVGGCSGGGCTVYAAVGRLKRDGSRDGTFGTNGKRSRDVEMGCTCAVGLAIQRDGRILIRTGQAASTNGYLLRYLPNGTLDRSFDGDAKMGQRYGGWDVAVRKDGRIVVAGVAPNGGFAVLRYLPSGRRDPSFGRNGLVITRFPGGGGVPSGVGIQGNGKIVVVGSAGSSFGVARYLP